MGTSDLFQKVVHAVQPGICRTCGTPFGTREMVDTGLNGDFCNLPHWDEINHQVNSDVLWERMGAVYFCESCVNNMGELFGMVSAVKAEAMRREIDSLHDQLVVLNDKNLGLEKILDGYRQVSSAGSVINDDLTDRLRTVERTETTESEFGQSVDSQNGDGANSGEPSSDQSDSVEQSSDVSSDYSSKPGEHGVEPINEEQESDSVLGF